MAHPQRKTFGQRPQLSAAPAPMAAPGRKSTLVLSLATLGALGLAGAVYATLPASAPAPAQSCPRDQNGAENCARTGRSSFFFFWRGGATPAPAPQAAQALRPTPPGLRPAMAPAAPVKFGGFGASATGHGAAAGA